MNALELTPLQAQQRQEHGACVVPGICVVCIEGGTGHDDIGPCGPWVEPPEWLDAAAPCETCGGRGLVGRPQSYYDSPCPDCRDGHKVWEVRAKCPKWDVLDGQRRNCRQCSGTGRVSLGRYTIELLAVRCDGRGAPWPGPHVEVIGDGCWLWVGTDAADYAWIEFDPLPVPGRDVVAVFTKADEP